jgi:inositol oxygenase
MSQLTALKEAIPSHTHGSVLYDYGNSDEGWLQLSTTEKISVNQKKTKDEFRTYEDESLERYDVVKNHYNLMRTNQTLAFVDRMYKKFHSFDKCEMTIWEAFEAMGDYVDASDPDIDLPNVEHAFQTAEAIRAAGHPEWMQLVGLIHDLGKVIFLWGAQEDGMDGVSPTGQQWALGGDTWAVGCALPQSAVFPEFNALNADMRDKRYNTKMGIYEKHCGLLKNVKFAYGHDEYMYRFLLHNKCDQKGLPREALAIVRLHSCYPWHTFGEYEDLMDDDDRRVLPWVVEFNKFDLYTKDNVRPDIEMLKPYYQALIEKYMGTGKFQF